MKLFHSPASPYVRKVMLVLHETGLIDQVEILTVNTSVVAQDEGLAAANPLARIPAMMLEDGLTLYDSRVICAYLDERADAGLFAGGWEVKVLEATADGIMDSAVSMAYELRLRPQEKQWDKWVSGQLQKVLGACAAIEARWMPLLQGPLNMGQIGVAAALCYVDFRHPNAGWREGNPQLTAWHAAFESRASMEATKS